MTIELSEPYEDDDYKIYFDNRNLLSHLNFLEDDNLFKINLLQDEEENVKKLKDASEGKYKMREKDIQDVHRSIVQLEKSRDNLMQRYKYLTGNITQSSDNHVQKKTKTQKKN